MLLCAVSMSACLGTHYFEPEVVETSGQEERISYLGDTCWFEVEYQRVMTKFQPGMAFKPFKYVVEIEGIESDDSAIVTNDSELAALTEELKREFPEFYEKWYEENGGYPNYSKAIVAFAVPANMSESERKVEVKVCIANDYRRDTENWGEWETVFSAVQEEMQMTLYVMGEAASTDRTAKLEVDASKTTAAASQYILPETVTVPAGKLVVPFVVTLMRSEELTSQTVSLAFKVVESNDFKVGVNEQNHFNMKWNDILGKPKNWDTELKEFFGEYSFVKYRFIIDTVGFGEFGNGMTWSELKNYQIVMKTALDEYNATPAGPLKDENGQLVEF